MKQLILISFLLISLEASAQVRKSRADSNALLESNRNPAKIQHPGVKQVLGIVEKSLESGSAASLAGLLGPEVSVNIPGRENGYFSSNQTLSILQSYFTSRKPVAFTFSRYDLDGANPYATGRLAFIYKGNQEFAQVYISFALQDSKWVVNQFNIY